MGALAPVVADEGALENEDGAGTDPDWDDWSDAYLGAGVSKRFPSASSASCRPASAKLDYLIWIVLLGRNSQRFAERQEPDPIIKGDAVKAPKAHVHPEADERSRAIAAGRLTTPKQTPG